ncbi:MAG: ParA family protein, partial [Spirosomataceae bacterium]
PYLTTALPGFFSYSDFVLVPTKASILDIMAIRATIQLLRQAQSLKAELKALIILNMVKPVTTLTEDIKEALQHYDFPLAETTISDRVSYTRSPISGGVFETDDNKAKDEIISLTQEIITALQQNQ